MVQLGRCVGSLGTRGDSPCPGARLPQRCCQPDGEIGAGTSRHPPSCASAFGVRQELGGLGTPLPTAPPAPGTLQGDPGHAAGSGMRWRRCQNPEKQLLGRKLIRAGLDGRSSFAFSFIPALQNQTALGDKSWMLPLCPQNPGAAPGRSKAAKGLGCGLARILGGHSSRWKQALAPSGMSPDTPR